MPISPVCSSKPLIFSFILLWLGSLEQGIAQESRRNSAEASKRGTLAGLTSKQSKSLSPRVRIGLKLTPYQHKKKREPSGKMVSIFTKSPTLRHTLRARLERTNHFFVGDWHIETQPLKWIKKSRRYGVRLSLYRRYGAFGQLEEKVGSVDLHGVLIEQADGLFVLNGVSQKTMKNKFGNPVLDVAVGYGKLKRVKISKGDKSSRYKRSSKPKRSHKSSVRSRF